MDLSAVAITPAGYRAEAICHFWPLWNMCSDTMPNPCRYSATVFTTSATSSGASFSGTLLGLRLTKAIRLYRLRRGCVEHGRDPHRIRSRLAAGHRSGRIRPTTAHGDVLVRYRHRLQLVV